jgi:hypothetical protein
MKDAIALSSIEVHAMAMNKLLQTMLLREQPLRH